MYATLNLTTYSPPAPAEDEAIAWEEAIPKPPPKPPPNALEEAKALALDPPKPNWRPSLALASGNTQQRKYVLFNWLIDKSQCVFV